MCRNSFSLALDSWPALNPQASVSAPQQNDSTRSGRAGRGGKLHLLCCNACQSGNAHQAVPSSGVGGASTLLLLLLQCCGNRGCWSARRGDRLRDGEPWRPGLSGVEPCKAAGASSPTSGVLPPTRQGSAATSLESLTEPTSHIAMASKMPEPPRCCKQGPKEVSNPGPSPIRCGQRRDWKCVVQADNITRQRWAHAVR